MVGACGGVGVRRSCGVGEVRSMRIGGCICGGGYCCMLSGGWRVGESGVGGGVFRFVAENLGGGYPILRDQKSENLLPPPQWGLLNAP